MIRIAGGVRRAFEFPGNLAAARAYFGDFERVAGLLPHIQLVRAHGPGQYRVLYRTTEMGLYDVRIYCDLQARLEDHPPALRVTPITAGPPVKPRVTLTSLTALGRYQSLSTFHAAGAHTRVEYRLDLHATLPKPLGLSLISDRHLEQIAHHIVAGRIHEIADGFIRRALNDYRKQSHRRR